MKLLRVQIEHFACLRQATVDFGPGLNVLYGPNDLGKSTLARAIRAALLLQHTSSVARDFVEWESDESPSVQLTLALPDGRVWRIEKRFATPGGASMLRESPDGNTFSPFKRGREVDDEVRCMLGWGIASPATKGAPRGLPPSFLGTVLLGEQADVVGVLAQTLESDSDESGRARLTSALAAFAQDPLFKSVLEEAQGMKDKAFTGTGRRRKGKTSPFSEVSEEVKRLAAELARIRIKLEEGEDARRALAGYDRALLERLEALEGAKEYHEGLTLAASRAEARRVVVQELNQATERLAAEETELRTFAERQVALRDAKEGIERGEQDKAKRVDEREGLAAAEKAAEGAVRRAKSAEAEQARQLRRGELDKRVLELKSDAKEVDEEREGAEKAQALRKTLLESTTASAALEVSLEENRARAAEAAQGAGEAKEELERLALAAVLLRHRRAQAEIDALDVVRVEVEADRLTATGRRAEADELAARITEQLPTRSELAAMRQLEHDLEVAEARLGGGLAVIVERLAAVELSATADGEAVEGLTSASDAVLLDAASLDAVSFDAERGFTLEVGELARITVTAGEREARRTAEELRGRWQAEVVPPLERLDIADLGTLSEAVGGAAELERKVVEARRAAEGLDDRASIRERQLDNQVALEEELAALTRELEGKPLETARAMLDDTGDDVIEARRLALEAKRGASLEARDEAEERGRAAQMEGRVLAERIDTARASLERLGLAEPPEGWDAGWEVRKAELDARASAVAAELERVGEELRELVAGQDDEIGAAEAALEQARARLAEADLGLRESAGALDLLKAKAGELRGELKNQKEQVDKLDVEASEARVNEIRARLAALPAPSLVPSEEQLRAAEASVAEATASHEAAKTEVQKAQGAMRFFEGHIVRENAETTERNLRIAEQKERDVELEFDAWRLLVETLREAENTEGQHLGEALSQPVTKRFSELTSGRYGKLEVASNLEATELSVSGVQRSIRKLSVGTQEQLATLLRLTIAEELGTTLLLDDHLTQTDPERSAWFRDVLREHAAKAQVIVLTCRPLHYLQESDMPAEDEASASRAAGLVRAVDMSKVVVRGVVVRPVG